MPLFKRKGLKLLKSDPILYPEIKNLKPIDDKSAGNVYNELTRSIIYQQISYRAANSIYQRFVDQVGKEDYQPKDILAQEFEDLKSAGLSYRKTEYIINIATFFNDEKLYDQDWDKFSDQEILDKLTQIKGVGQWTVEMILIFELERQDVFPIGDLAIRQAIEEIYGLDDTIVKKQHYKNIHAIADDWKPYRTLASLYLWSWKRAKKSAKR